MLKCALGQMPSMEKEIGERFFLNYFISIFIHQTISTYHNKVTQAWRYRYVHLNFDIIAPLGLF